MTNNLITIATCMAAIATCWAAIMASKAYKESLKARKSAAFIALFAQLINNHNSLFKNVLLAKTELTKKTHDFEIDRYIINSNNDIFTNFYNYCNLLKESIISKNYVDTKEISIKILNTWNRYVDNIQQSVYFSHCFKYVRYEIEAVLHGTSETYEQKHYLGIIQANMSHAELFSYFINLLQHYLKKFYIIDEKEGTFIIIEQKNDYNIENNAILDGIKKNEFFRDLRTHIITKHFIEELWEVVKDKEADPLHRIINCIIDPKTI